MPRAGLTRARHHSLSEILFFSIRFLLVEVPYLSEYLDGVTDMVDEDLEDEEFWERRV